MATRSASVSTHDAMLDAAKDLMREIGYESLSHSDITAAVGMGRTTFYEHFASKEDLLVELVRRDLPPVTDDILASVDPDLAPQERLYELTRRMVRFVGTDHVGSILHTEVLRLSPRAQRDIGDAHLGIAKEFASIYREGVESGAFREIPRSLVGPMMESIVMTGGRVVMDSKQPSRDAEEIAVNTAETLVAALSDTH